MLQFDSDYMEGAHPRIIERLTETNLYKTLGYGEDEYCERAQELIRAACGCEKAKVRLLVGGTQTNATVIRSLLKPYEGVISADTGHINGHEAGAVEAGGHKIIQFPHRDGKLDADVIREWLNGYYADDSHEHTVRPGMIYISHPTEYGTLYTKAELSALSKVCRDFGMYLFLDGARLGYGLAADGTDVTLPDIAALCDVFYIGGTKVGALFGEAVVFTDPELDRGFFSMMKQCGALLAKGRLLGIQFETLFTDGLYTQISRHAIDMAMKLKSGLTEKGYSFRIDSPTNQQFPILSDEKLAEVREKVSCRVWERLPDGGSVIRLTTSWATEEADIDALLSLM